MPESALIVKCDIQTPGLVFIFNSSIAFLETSYATQYPSRCLCLLILFFLLYSSRMFCGLMLSSIDACITKCQISISSSRAFLSSKLTFFFHHFQFVSLWSSMASWVIAVERHEILSSKVLGYLSEAISAANSFCNRNIVSSLSNGLRPQVMPFAIYSVKRKRSVISQLINLY